MDLSTGSAADHRIGLLALPPVIAGGAQALVEANGANSDLEDPDHDGICNLLEYAFGLDPNMNIDGLLPQPVTIDGAYVITFVEPVGTAGLLYSAEWSPSLLPGSWIPLPDTGSDQEHSFSLPVETHPKAFFRLMVTRP